MTMTPLKLVDEMGEILGAVILPNPALMRLMTQRTVVLYWTPPLSAFRSDAPGGEVIDNHAVRLGPAHVRDDAVMIFQGTLYDFERCAGCFFIPGYAFTMKGRR
jgi:hypothetical protein